MESIENSEQVLLEKAKKGDVKSFEALIEMTSGNIYNLGLRLLRNKADAADMMQETYIKAYENLDGFQGKSSFSTWLYRIATNVALMKLRKEKNKKATVVDLKDTADRTYQQSVPDWTQNPARHFRNNELKDILTRAIDDLPPKYKSVFVLHDIQGLPIAEVADILSLSVPAVKTRSHRSRLFLREQLAGFFHKEEAPV